VKVKKRKPTVVKPPAGDVASSGGDYGRKKAAPTVKRELHTIKVRQTQVKDVKSRKDLARAPAYVKAHPKKHKGGVLGVADSLLSGKATAGAVRLAEKAAEKAAPIAATAVAPALSATAHALGKGSTFNKLAKNSARDLVDIPANTVPSVYVPAKLTVTGHPGKAAKMLAQPFEDTFGHGIKGFVKAAVAHPVGTGLLVRGGEGALGHGLGRTMRTGVLGKGAKRAASVEREAKTLPHARVTVQRRHSGDVIAKHAKILVRKATKKPEHHTMTPGTFASGSTRTPRPRRSSPPTTRRPQLTLPRRRSAASPTPLSPSPRRGSRTPAVPTSRSTWPRSARSIRISRPRRSARPTSISRARSPLR
jgi:hypothetical protein